MVSSAPPFLFLLISPLLHQVASSSVQDGPLNNGGFETAPSGGFPSSNVAGEAAVTAIPGWSVEGTVEMVEAGEKQGGMVIIVPEGKHAVRLGNDAAISQSVSMENGAVYGVTFSAARTCAQLESLNVSVAAAFRTVDLQTLYSVIGWDTYACAFNAPKDSEPSAIAFRNTGMEDDPSCGPIVDNVAVKKLFVPDRPRGNLAINGDMEEGPWMFPNATLGVLLPTNLDEGASALPGWTVESDRAVRYVDSDHFDVPQGKRAVELLSGKEGVISQMVETTPYKHYILGFSVGEAGDKCQGPLAVMAFAGDQAQSFHYSPVGNATSQAGNLTFVARAERTRIAFYSIYYNTRSDDRSSLCGPVVDDVRVSRAPRAAAAIFRLSIWVLVVVVVLVLG